MASVFITSALPDYYSKVVRGFDVAGWLGLYAARADPLTFAAAALALAAVALAACLLPALRASRIAPAMAPRNE